MNFVKQDERHPLAVCMAQDRSYATFGPTYVAACCLHLKAGLIESKMLKPGYDSPGIAPRGACPPPEIRKARLVPLRHFQKKL